MNYTELKQAIEDYLENDETSFTGNLDTFIKQAENRIYHDVQLSSARKHSTGSMTSGNKFLTLPSDFLAAHSIKLLNGTSYSYLVNKDENFLNEAYPDDTDTGTPKYYGIVDTDTLILGPVPDDDYAVELTYFYRPESIITAATTWIGDNFEMVLLNACLVEAYRYMKGEADLIELYEASYQEGMALLENLGHGRLRQDNFRTMQIRRPVR